MTRLVLHNPDPIMLAKEDTRTRDWTEETATAIILTPVTRDMDGDKLGYLSDGAPRPDDPANPMTVHPPTNCTLALTAAALCTEGGSRALRTPLSRPARCALVLVLPHSLRCVTDPQAPSSARWQ